MGDKMAKKINYLKISGVFIIAALLVFVAFVIFADDKENICMRDKCNNLYLGVCFDENSSFYMCNTEKEQCSLIDWDIVNTIKFMEDNNLVIYGVSGCGWCKKQLEEFNEFSEYLKSSGLYIDCGLSKNSNVCSDVRGTPTWKKDDAIITSGYRPLSDIKNII